MNTQTSLPAPQEADFNRLHVGDSWFNQTQQEFLERYVTYTDSLIGKMLHFETDQDGTSHPADVVMYLDKSARPVAWMTRELWPMLAEPDSSGEIPPMPEMKFINIDRLPWRVDPAVEITQDPANFRNPTQQDIDGIRSIYALPNQGPDDPNPLDGKRILIVDEVSDSGDTTYVTNKLLQKAFPTSKTAIHNWMNEYELAYDGEKVVNDRPVWYQKDEESGRLVFGQVAEGSTSANTKTNLTEGAHQFLSTRPRIPVFDSNGDIRVSSIDKRGMALKEDVTKMAELLRNHVLMPVPDHTHEAQYNGMPIDEYGVTRTAILAERASRSIGSLLKK